MTILIKNGRLIDPSQAIDDQFDLLVKDGVIAEVGKDLHAADAELIDAQGLLVVPGLIDLHVHLRDPGLEYKEDIISGTKAAVAGGFTSVACMPNTKPVNDNQSVTRYIINKAREEGSCNVFPIGSVSKGMAGETLSEMGEMHQSGAVGFSDDGLPVSSGELMRRALEYARPFGFPIVSHAEDLSIAGKGVMNDGFVATELGLKGIPWVAEDAMTSRDIMLAEFTGGKLHVAHVSTRGGIAMVRDAKKRGVAVTCEVTPHHFTLTEEAVRGYQTNAKMNPPLRVAEDVAAIREGLADGTVDAIATDHAPHHYDEKNVEFVIALNGIVGLETALPLTLRLVKEGVITLSRAIELLSSGPARAFGLQRGSLAVGQVADIALIDPELKWTVTADTLHSKSKNSPFLGEEMVGAPRMTLVAGQIVYQRD